jgi:hypothetical protein
MKKEQLRRALCTTAVVAAALFAGLGTSNSIQSYAATDSTSTQSTTVSASLRFKYGKDVTAKQKARIEKQSKKIPKVIRQFMHNVTRGVKVCGKATSYDENTFLVIVNKNKNNSIVEGAACFAASRFYNPDALDELYNSEYSAFEEVFSSDLNKVFKKYESNSKNYFKEAFYEYFMNKNTLKKAAPDTYAHIQEKMDYLKYVMQSN